MVALVAVVEFKKELKCTQFRAANVDAEGSLGQRLHVVALGWADNGIVCEPHARIGVETDVGACE